MSAHATAPFEAPQIELEASPDQVLRFRLSHANEAQAELEGSLNLEDWFTLAGVAPANGSAQFSFTNDASAATWFFRGVLNPGPKVGRIVAQVDTNLTAGILLTPDAGGTMAVQDSRGIIYEFTAGTNLVWEPVAVQMTVITNFTEFPEHDGARAAVRFSPEGFAFRGEARLRIVFPESLNPSEMMAYAFEDDGSGFHLSPSTPGSNEVVLALTHFSGRGVARFSDARVPNFDRAWNGAKSAIRAAEQRTALRNREALREHYVKAAISLEELDQRFKENALRKLDEIYRGAVQPFERAGSTDCAIGQAVVMGELERLAGQWAELTGKSRRESPFYPKLQEFAPRVRCACARRLIERCEKEPGVSGSALLNELEFVLLTSRLYTGSTDAQGCDLGSDEQIRDRLVSGPCFGLWEGSIRMTRIQSRKGSATGSVGGLPGSESYDNEIKEVFRAEISRVMSQDIFIDNQGRLNEFWVFKLAGPYSVGYRQNEIVSLDLGDIVAITKETANAAASPLGAGETTLLLLDGKFESLGPGGGTATTTPRYNLPLTFINETSYQCKTSWSPNIPCPTGETDRTKSSYSLYQGYSVNARDPKLNVTVNAKGLSLTWTRHSETPQSSGPSKFVDEEIVVTFRRAPSR